MSTSTKIEWTPGDDGMAGATWKPVTGCSEVSDVRLWPDRLERLNSEAF